MKVEFKYRLFCCVSFQGCTNATFSPWMEKLDSSWIIQHSLIEIDWTQNYTSVNHTHNAVLSPLVNHERCDIFHLHGTTCVTLEQKCVESDLKIFLFFFQRHRTIADTLFGMTYMYYAVLGTFVTIIVGIIVSYFTASDEDNFDENLMHPSVVKLRHWYNGTSPVPAQTENIQQNARSNVNEAYEITEVSEDTTVNSIVNDSNDLSIHLNEIKNCKTQLPIERFTKLSVS